MLQKLFSLVDQTSVPDNPDSLQNQEVLLPGHLIAIYLKVENLKLESFYRKLKAEFIEKKCLACVAVGNQMFFMYASFGW